jgi:hypothetical protein
MKSALRWFHYADIYRVYKGYVIIIDAITLFSIYLLGNLHLTQNGGGIRLSQGEEIHPIP